MKKVTREQLKQKVNKAVDLVPPGTFFIAGVTQAKEYKGQKQMILEIVQVKMPQKTNVLALLNKGDDRFQASLRVVRLWLKVTAEGFNAVFNKAGIDGKEILEEIQSYKKGEVCLVLKDIPTINIHGVDEVPQIQIKQYSAADVNDLPSKIAELVIAEEDGTITEDQALTLNRIKKQTKDGNEIVDANGNQVYEDNQLSFGNVEDQYVQGMQLKSEWEKVSTKVGTKRAATANEATKNLVESTLQSMLNDED